MKSLRLILLAAFLIPAFALNAQNAKLNGTSYTIVMIDEANAGEEIVDQISFENDNLVSSNLSKEGFSNAKVTQNGEKFSVTLSKSAGESMTYEGTVTDEAIYGTIVSTRQGQTTNFVFRGMTTAQWNAVQKTKQDTE